MKLLNKIMFWFTGIVFLVTPISMYVSYNNIKAQIDKSHEQRMAYENSLIAKELLKGTSPDKLTNGHAVKIEKIAGSLPEKREVITEQSSYIPALKRKECLLTVHSFYNINGQNYEISTSNYVTKSNQIFHGMMNAVIWKIILILLGVFIAARFLSQQIIGPFKKTMKAINHFNIKKREKIKLPQTNIKEFKELNRFLERMTERAVEDYASVKEFSENASHELQTPLAVMRTKLELLSNSNIDASQASLITDMHNAIEKLSRINRSLTILTKLDNKEFETTEVVKFDKVATEVFDVYSDRASLKDICIETHIDKQINVKMHPALADMLLNNLVGNAIRHNVHGGIISADITHKNFSIRNTGLPPEIPTEDLFKRFKKSNQCAESIGLGLAIVKQICEVSNFDLSYIYEDGWHHIQVNFNSN